MEQNIKQHTLTLERGLTSVPSDLVCPDNTLSSVDGLVYLDGEYKPLQNPVDAEKKSDNYTIALVHLLNNGSKNYLYYNGSGNTKSLIFAATTLATNVIDVKSIGNTIIANTTSGLRYFLWKPSASAYDSLGDKIPFPQMRFQLDLSASEKELSSTIHYTLLGGDIVDRTTLTISYGDNDDHFQSFSDSIIGEYAKLRKQAAEKSGFVFPFFVRYAIEMYDGTYVMPSNPILVCPSLTTNFSCVIDSTRNDFIKVALRYFKLQYKNISNQDYSLWSDIVNKVVIFATSEVELYNLDNIYNPELVGDDKKRQYTIASTTIWDNPDSSSVIESSFSSLLKKRTAESINKEIETFSVFYKIAEVDLKYQGSYVNVPIIDKTLLNLTTQQTLVNSSNGDDFYAQCAIKADNIYTFNRRLNVANASRSFFEGFKQFGPALSNGTSTTAKVYINTPNGMVHVSTTITVGTFSNSGYFYYPDPRAEYVTIGSATYKLKKHPGLNGAYCFAGIDGSNLSSASAPSATEGTWESLPNYLLQSEVDNPFTFFASGYVRVGQGTILGMAGLTTALTQDAYKISTTLVFTTQGIWALRINDEGQYTSVAPPFSREVCTNANTITMTDNAVFFASRKGLMCVTGTSENSVVCVSPQLRDSAFVSFLCNSNCRIAYDYKESLLYVYNIGSKEAYIYSISTGTWTHDTDCFDGNDDTFLTCVTDYPDTLVQTSDHVVFSFYNRDNRNTDTDKFNCSLETRPVKFDGSLILDSIRQLKHLVSPDVHICASEAAYNTLASALGQLSTPVYNPAALILTIKGSNDLKTWTTVPSLKGKPYKFFKFHYDFKNLKATSTFAGTSFFVQQRYTEKML